MSHPPRTSLPIPDFSPQTKTLLMQHPGTAAFLLWQEKRKQKVEAMQFGTPAAALAWCLKHRANFYCVMLSDAKKN